MKSVLPRGRSAFDLEAPQDEDAVGLCNLGNAHMFETVPTNGSARLSADNLAAKRLCWQCPARLICLEKWRRQPARDRAHHVAAGYAWDSRGEIVR